jgi:hypothetical protein
MVHALRLDFLLFDHWQAARRHRKASATSWAFGRLARCIAKAQRVRSDTPSFARPLKGEQLDGEAKAIGERLCTSQYVHKHDDDDCLLSKPYEWQPLQDS